ncbi:MAG: C45 family autoproteolytic acyltransferase/hydrolase [Chloroflexota bacterium]
MRLLRLQGNHYQMGFQHGQQVRDLRPLIVGAAEKRLATLEARTTAGLLAELERTWAVHARSTLDMLAGMAGALALDADLLFRYAAASYLEDRLRDGSGAEECTVWAASGPATVGGLPILTKNRDFSLAHLPLQALALATPEDGYRYLYVTSAGSPGVYSSGMNVKGLAIADTYVPCSDNGPGLPRYTLMMELLEHHTSVASALDYLVSMPRMGPGNLVLADADGEMAVFELGHRYWGVVRAANHVVAATNHFVTPALRGYNVRPAQGGTDDESEARHRSIRRRVSEGWGSLSGDEARRIMARHADGEAAICRHDLAGVSGTISNVIFLPAERSLLFCDGRPCEGDYAPHSL